VESAVILAESNSLLLPQYFTLNREEPESRLIHDLEKDYILQALEKNRFNRTLAAQELNMSRKTLYNKMKKYSIE
jgi:DNA-binding NtrC family response regulator